MTRRQILIITKEALLRWPCHLWFCNWGRERMGKIVPSRLTAILCVCRNLKQQGIRKIYGRSLRTSVVKLPKAGGSHAWRRRPWVGQSLVPTGAQLWGAAADISCAGVEPRSCFPKQATLSTKTVIDSSTCAPCLYKACTENANYGLKERGAKWPIDNKQPGHAIMCEALLLLRYNKAR